jgi:hypothetical protein
MGIWTLIFLAYSWAAPLHLLERWSALPAGQNRPLQIKQMNQSAWQLQLPDSGMAPRLKASGQFQAKLTAKHAEATEQLDERLKFRASILGAPYFAKQHQDVAQVNQHRFPIAGEFGNEVEALLSEFLEAKWTLINGHQLLPNGRIEERRKGRAIASFLPEESLHCRWLQTVWSCEFPEGTLRFPRRKP